MKLAQNAAATGNLFHLGGTHGKAKVELIHSIPSSMPMSLSRPKVLVVDDERAVAEFVRRALQLRLAGSVRMAANGAEAIQAIQEESFDLIISDVRMPVLNGVGLIEWIQRSRPEQMARFFLISGDVGSPEVAHTIQQLGVEVLSKPFGVDLLISTAQRYLENSGSWMEEEALSS